MDRKKIKDLKKLAQSSDSLFSSEIVLQLIENIEILEQKMSEFESQKIKGEFADYLGEKIEQIIKDNSKDIK